MNGVIICVAACSYMKFIVPGRYGMRAATVIIQTNKVSNLWYVITRSWQAQQSPFSKSFCTKRLKVFLCT